METRQPRRRIPSSIPVPEPRCTAVRPHLMTSEEMEFLLSTLRHVDPKQFFACFAISEARRNNQRVSGSRKPSNICRSCLSSQYRQPHEACWETYRGQRPLNPERIIISAELPRYQATILQRSWGLETYRCVKIPVPKNRCKEVIDYVRGQAIRGKVIPVVCHLECSRRDY